MKKRGRPPKPDEVKAKKGTLRGVRVVQNQPKGVVLKGDFQPPIAPEFLGKIGAEHWDIQIGHLAKMGMLSKTDLGVLAMLCKEYENYVEAEKALTEHKQRFYSGKTDGGNIYYGIHPAHTIAQQHLKSYIGLCTEFGFSPAARSRISLPVKENEPSKVKTLLRNAV